ncbi:MAG TPA: discoidin domain-containing protein [Spirochaetota bacterium]|nr:discoidin domain-containing protein [Spirochaetota bacterium]
MEPVNVSIRKIHGGTVSAFSSQLDEEHSPSAVLADGGYWSTQKSNSIVPEFVIVDFGEVVPVDCVEICAAPAGKTTFPHDFRVEVSVDGGVWRVVQSERKYEMEESLVYRLDMPLALIRFIRLYIVRPRKTGAKFFSEIGSIRAGIGGAREVSASSHSSYEFLPARLLDGNDDTFWESEIRTGQSREHVELDLGRVLQVNGIWLVSAGVAPHGFPESFYVEVSTDRTVWAPLFEEKYFSAQPSMAYFHEAVVTPARYVRVEMSTISLGAKTFGARLAGFAVSAAPFEIAHTHNIGELTPQASIFQAGVVRLARDGGDSLGTVVQASDRRLRDATTIFKGIVQLAEDGDDRPGFAVQSSDSRFKPASELRPGVVRLAYDRENKPGVVVQASDSRLAEATENTYGIVRLCPDAVYSDMSVVRGTDSRLKKATTTSHGICRLAGDGENNSECVVQGSDRRLRNGTTINKGIIELAEDGEDAECVAVQGNDRRLKNATTMAKGIVELAEDGEDAAGVAVQGNDRRLQNASEKAKGILRFAKDGEDSSLAAVQGNDRRLKNATTKAKGIVELAEDGEDRGGVVVQGNDRRLKNASETAMGILRFAKDGEDDSLIAVQGSDRRLKNATTMAMGILRFAKDGEDDPLIAVQGSDRRLKNATTTAKGIVELAEDGEDREGVVVQGSDRRLKNASETARGILRFAEDGEEVALTAVQGSDRRLKNATTTAKGIVELADDGEDAGEVVVQGNDRRLKNATTLAKGIVELAEDGEDAAGVVVQGNDRRLKNATESAPGIVVLAANGEIKKGAVLQSDDARLSDPREPLPHAHNYAPLVHAYSGHSGTISVTEKRSEAFVGIAPPPDSSAVVYAKNESPGDGSVGVIGVSAGCPDGAQRSWGVIGHGAFAGVKGQSPGNGEAGPRGCGVIGVSRFGAGGVFASEHSYSLVADGYGSIGDFDDTVNLVGNGEALLVKGSSEFHGRMRVHNRSREGSFPANIVEMFEVDDIDYISPGDILTASAVGGGVLSRSSGAYMRSVVGIVSGNPTLVIDNTGESRKAYPVALAGRVLCKVDARGRPIRPGDLIVTSETPGCGMAGEIDSFAKIGTVIGKALDGLSGGMGTISVFVAHL